MIRLPPSPIVTSMKEQVPRELALIAGKGAYPRLLAESARKQGVERIFAVAFSRETERSIEKLVDEVVWIPLGKGQALLDAIQGCGIHHAVMAGLVTPTTLFRVRLDTRAIAVLRRLSQKNAHSIFGAVVDELAKIGVKVLPASSFMETHMPDAGLLSARTPTDREQSDIDLGLAVADLTSGLNIGQTVVIKHGTILAVEAFEGTDEAIRRAGRLGGAGVVVVKVAKRGHDMRFDIPVVGLQTMKVLKKVGATALAVRAGRAILLEKEKLIECANRIGLCLTVVPDSDSEQA